MKSQISEASEPLLISCYKMDLNPSFLFVLPVKFIPSARRDIRNLNHLPDLG